MYPLTNGYQQVMVYGNAPPMFAIGVVALIALALVALSFFMFRRSSPEMVDVL